MFLSISAESGRNANYPGIAWFQRPTPTRITGTSFTPFQRWGSRLTHRDAQRSWSFPGGTAAMCARFSWRWGTVALSSAGASCNPPTFSIHDRRMPSLLHPGSEEACACAPPHVTGRYRSRVFNCYAVNFFGLTCLVTLRFIGMRSNLARGFHFHSGWPEVFQES